MLNFSCAKRIPFVPISGTGKFLDRSIPRARGFVQPFAKKKKCRSRATRNENYGIIYFQASCSRLAATFPTARRYHSTVGILKRAINSVYETWQGRGMDLVEKFSIRPSLPLHLNFRFSFDLFEICSFFATRHSTC